MNKSVSLTKSENTLLPKVLIVDDDAKNIFAMKVALEDQEINIIEAASGMDALREVASNEIALILLDVQMAGMDGFEVVELLKKNKNTKEIPIIFVTAVSKDQSYVQKGHEIGAVDYLFKPIEPVILISKVNIFVNYYKQRKQMLFLLKQLEDVKVDLENSNKQLGHLARIDPITGLANRFSLDEYLHSAIKKAEKDNTTFGVVYLDLDNFKYVNDTYGPQVSPYFITPIRYQ